MPCHNNRKFIYLGLMSGTSVDGVDIAAVDFSNDPFVTLKTLTVDYPPGLRQRLVDLGGHTSVDEYAKLDSELGTFYGQCISEFKHQEVWEDQIAAVGSHGHTAYHLPEFNRSNTLQIGNPHIMCALSKLPVVSDFRRRDMAAGGQGAPIVPAFHRYIATSHIAQEKTLGVLNLGGIANLTILNNTQELAFDTGPANTLLDTWHARHQGEHCDHEGAWARGGTCNETLLNSLLNDAYFGKAPPKSTGKEHFNMEWLNVHLDHAIAPNDVQRTLVELTVISIYNAATPWLQNMEEILICGGGVNNTFLVERLSSAFDPVPVGSTETLGIAPDFVEAIAFAWFAKERLAQNVLQLSPYTGADDDFLAGIIYHP